MRESPQTLTSYLFTNFILKINILTKIKTDENLEAEEKEEEREEETTEKK